MNGILELDVMSYETRQIMDDLTHCGCIAKLELDEWVEEFECKLNDDMTHDEVLATLDNFIAKLHNECK